MFITRRITPFLFGFLFEVPEDGGQAPNVETPEATQQQQEVDWAKRYSDLQPEYTRATQEAAQLRTEREAYRQLLTSEDPDTRRQAAEALGLQIDEETVEDDTQDPLEDLRREVLALKEGQSQAQQSQRLARMEAHAERELDTLQVPQSEDLRDWIVSRAIALPPTQDGMPDIRAAHLEFEALIAAQKKQWASTKQTHQISAVGQAGTQTPDLSQMSRDDRDAWMAERWRALGEP